MTFITENEIFSLKLYKSWYVQNMYFVEYSTKVDLSWCAGKNQITLSSCFVSALEFHTIQFKLHLGVEPSTCESLRDHFTNRATRLAFSGTISVSINLIINIIDELAHQVLVHQPSSDFEGWWCYPVPETELDGEGFEFGTWWLKVERLDRQAPEYNSISKRLLLNPFKIKS